MPKSESVMSDGATDGAALGTAGTAKKNPITTIATKPSTLAVVSMFWVHFPSRTPMMLTAVSRTIEPAA